jgi:3'-5' exoribonuclease
MEREIEVAGGAAGAGDGEQAGGADSASWKSLSALKGEASAGAVEAAVRGQLERVEEKVTKGGAPYLEWGLRDASDGLTVRVWENHPQFAAARRLGRGVFVEVRGEWSKREPFGLEVGGRWNFRELGAEEVAAALAGDPELAERQEADYGDIVAMVGAMADPRLRAVCELFLERHGEAFRRCAAARDYHHARRGGLVEHVAQMMRSASALCVAYPELNGDLLLAGVLFHDCGKLWENNYEPSGFQMLHHEMGELLGHIPVGIELANRLWHEAADAVAGEVVEGEDAARAGNLARLHLLHLIASHHGEHEFGAPTLPKTPEALVLHHVDNIDAKLEMMRRGYRESAQVGPGIYDRVRPLRQRLVRRLEKVEDSE